MGPEALFKGTQLCLLKDLSAFFSKKEPNSVLEKNPQFPSFKDHQKSFFKGGPGRLRRPGTASSWARAQASSAWKPEASVFFSLCHGILVCLIVRFG